MTEKPNTILAKINVSKIVKEKLFKGEKGTYLDIVLVPTKDSQYGDDYMIFQGSTKEERLAGVKGAIIGNGKFMPRKQDAPKAAAPTADTGSCDVPF